ncbi:MAG: SH3 domain-containing protein [Blastocatellia bacterium]|nr:SH3 domain-containing protein [Blastocatellia bacterium]
MDHNRAVLYKTITISKNNYVYERSDRRSNRIEVLKEGEYVAVIAAPGNRWLQIISPSGRIGWVESRDLLSRSDFEEWQKLAKSVEKMRVQSRAETYVEANLRLRPGRDSTTLIKIPELSEVEIYALAHTVRPGSEATRHQQEQKKQTSKPPPPKPGKPGIMKPKKPEGPSYDTWYLVRTSNGMVGWIYSGLAYLKVPEELALVSEGKTIIAWYAISFVKAENGEYKPNYLSIEREPGSNRDFDRVRLLYWNPRRKRLELAYRIQNIQGVLPVEVTPLEPGHIGTATFRIRHIKSPGTVVVDDYQINDLKVSLLKSISEPFG